jgi:hypothetical protein
LVLFSVVKNIQMYPLSVAHPSENEVRYLLVSSKIQGLKLNLLLLLVDPEESVVIMVVIGTCDMAAFRFQSPRRRQHTKFSAKFSTWYAWNHATNMPTAVLKVKN